MASSQCGSLLETGNGLATATEVKQTETLQYIQKQHRKEFPSSEEVGQIICIFSWRQELVRTARPVIFKMQGLRLPFRNAALKIGR